MKTETTYFSTEAWALQKYPQYSPNNLTGSFHPWSEQHLSLTIDAQDKVIHGYQQNSLSYMQSNLWGPWNIEGVEHGNKYIKSKNICNVTLKKIAFLVASLLNNISLIQRP